MIITMCLHRNQVLDLLDTLVQSVLMGLVTLCVQVFCGPAWPGGDSGAGLDLLVFPMNWKTPVTVIGWYMPRFARPGSCGMSARRVR
jgi:hypothetical protein